MLFFTPDFAVTRSSDAFILNSSTCNASHVSARASRTTDHDGATTRRRQGRGSAAWIRIGMDALHRTEETKD